jgi:hypothetical protein
MTILEALFGAPPSAAAAHGTIASDAIAERPRASGSFSQGKSHSAARQEKRVLGAFALALLLGTVALFAFARAFVRTAVRPEAPTGEPWRGTAMGRIAQAQRQAASSALGKLWDARLRTHDARMKAMLTGAALRHTQGQLRAHLASTPLKTLDAEEARMLARSFSLRLGRAEDGQTGSGVARDPRAVRVRADVEALARGQAPPDRAPPGPAGSRPDRRPTDRLARP